MTQVRLSGALHCRDASESETVRRHLPAHIALTRSESGCLAFEVQATDDPLVWSVEERFTDPASFAAHQRRTASSPWGLETRGIERRYEVTGL